jgi:hypothetical protein
MTHRRAYLLGHPVAHSHSPALHNAAFQALGTMRTTRRDALMPRCYPRLCKCYVNRTATGRTSRAHKQRWSSTWTMLERSHGSNGTRSSTKTADWSAPIPTRGFARWTREVNTMPRASRCSSGAGGARGDLGVGRRQRQYGARAQPNARARTKSSRAAAARRPDGPRRAICGKPRGNDSG